MEDSSRTSFKDRIARIALAPALLVSAAPLGPPDEPEERPKVEEVLRALGEKYGANEKKYAALVARIDKAVRKALASAPASPEAAKPLGEHPFLELVEELAAPLRGKPPKAPLPAARELLARHPWSARLELVVGLEFGSDRPVPEHENGFVALGELPAPDADLPAPPVNLYLPGLQEVVGWRGSVEEKKGLAFRDRTAKDAPPAIELELPPWEALRVYLRGSLPEVSLFAIPRLTHLLHARLAERRSAGGAPAPMDEMLAFLDARWNAFAFTTPYSKTRTAVALPVLELIADRSGFVYRFPTGQHLGTTGDIPFVSDPTMRAYALAFRNEDLSIGDFIGQTASATAARDAFWGACVHLSRYRALLDLLVRALLEPASPLPATLAECDFPAGKPLAECSARELDVPRKHALLLWARAGKDPRALADLLFERVLDLEMNRFPQKVSLQSELAHFARKNDAEFLAAIQARLDAADAGALAAEFAPLPRGTEGSGPPSTEQVARSYHASAAAVSEVVRAVAYTVVGEELGKR